MTSRGCLIHREQFVDRNLERVCDQRKLVSARRRVAVLPVPDHRLVGPAPFAELGLSQPLSGTKTRELGVVEGPGAFLGHAPQLTLFLPAVNRLRKTFYSLL